MNSTHEIKQVSDYNKLRNVTTVHPLVSVIDFATLKSAIPPAPREGIEQLRFNCYALFLKQSADCELRYGRRPYDFQEGTLVFLAPGQCVEVSSTRLGQRPPAGYALLFHPDLFAGLAFAEEIFDYPFFSYEIAEGLHISEKERQIIVDCLYKIGREAAENQDAHSRRLIVSNIQLLLNYCQRYYSRQFHTRFRENQDVIVRFERLLLDYFQSNRAAEQGLPSVSFFAKELHLSPNYFGDLVSQHLGKSPRELIQAKTLEQAKVKLLQPGQSISEVAYDLGFKQPQHFTRFIKQHLGMTPSEFQKNLD